MTTRPKPIRAESPFPVTGKVTIGATSPGVESSISGGVVVVVEGVVRAGCGTNTKGGGQAAHDGCLAGWF